MDAEPTTPAPQPAAQASKAEPPKPAEKKSDEVSVARKSSPRSDSGPVLLQNDGKFSSL